MTVSGSPPDLRPSAAPKAVFSWWVTSSAVNAGSDADAGPEFHTGCLCSLYQRTCTSAAHGHLIEAICCQLDWRANLRCYDPQAMGEPTLYPIPSSQVYLSEVLDFSNAATGFSVLGMQAAIGRLLGPSLGGILANPTLKFEALRDVTLFQTFPFLLPCLISAGVAAIGIAVAYWMLPETLQPKDSLSLPGALRLTGPPNSVECV